MAYPAVTVVIALYNGAEFIRDALNGVRAQTLAPARTIVVDDGSTDEGPAIVAQIAGDQNITLLRKSNGGQSSARNLGISHAGTPLVALLDQDDVWYPRHLECLAAPFQTTADPRLGWVYSNLDTIDRRGNPIARGLLDRFTSTEHPKRTLEGCIGNDMFVVPSATLIHVESFRRVGGFDEELTGYEDDDLFLRMFRHGYGNRYLPEPLTQWRIYADSASCSPVMLQSRMKYFNKLCNTLSETGRNGRPYADTYVAPRFFRATLLDFQHALRDGDQLGQAQALSALHELLPHLAAGTRLPARMILPLAGVLRLPPAGRAAAAAAPAVWAAWKRLAAWARLASPRHFVTEQSGIAVRRRQPATRLIHPQPGRTRHEPPA